MKSLAVCMSYATGMGLVMSSEGSVCVFESLLSRRVAGNFHSCLCDDQTGNSPDDQPRKPRKEVAKQHQVQTLTIPTYIARYHIGQFDSTLYSVSHTNKEEQERKSNDLIISLTQSAGEFPVWSSRKHAGFSSRPVNGPTCEWPDLWMATERAESTPVWSPA